MASEPGISGNLEKSGNFKAFEKCQGKVREFSWEIGKSQGILLPWNEYCRSLFKIHSSGEQDLVMAVRDVHSCICLYIGKLYKIKNF